MDILDYISIAGLIINVIPLIIFMSSKNIKYFIISIIITAILIFANLLAGKYIEASIVVVVYAVEAYGTTGLR